MLMIVLPLLPWTMQCIQSWSFYPLGDEYGRGVAQCTYKLLLGLYSNEPQIPDMVNSRGDHRQRAYNTEERAVIDVHKVTYLQATSPAERKQIAKEILADLFNHWSQKGILFTEVDITIRTKVFIINIGIDIYPLLSAKVTCGMDPEQLAISSHFSEEGGRGKNENIRGFMEKSTSRSFCRDCDFARHRVGKCKYTWLVQWAYAGNR